MLALASAFILLFGLAQGRNSPHYVLTSYVALDVFAGLGWFHALQWLGGRVNALGSVPAQALALVVVLAVQARSAAAAHPYYFTYENPLLAGSARGEFPQFAYGEGLELAAGYLAGLPGAQDQTALVYYSRGCFSYFYPGQTERFKPYLADPGNKSDLREALAKADYLVLYYAIQGSSERYAELFRNLAPVKPEREIWMNGYKYAMIYRIESFPPAVLTALTEP
jgi:hypothetical protein